MPETMLQRYNARQAERDALIERFTAEAKSRAITFGKSPVCQDGRHDDCIGLAPHRDFADCLCDCHDPAWTYWVEWYACPRTGLLTPGSMVSGHYGTRDEAIDDGFAAKPAEADWIRNNWDLNLVEQVTGERWDALGNWDEKTDAEKGELRAAIRTGGAS